MTSDTTAAIGRAILGLAFFCFIAWLLSSHRRRFPMAPSLPFQSRFGQYQSPPACGVLAGQVCREAVR